MDQPIDIPYDVIIMLPELEAAIVGEGIDEQGRHYIVQHYDSKDGQVFRCVFVTANAPRCTNVPSPAY